MKKIVIAGASLALAAMPVLGAFANSVTDTVQVTIQSACTVAASSGGASGTDAGRTFSAELANGGTKQWQAGETGADGGGVLTFSCNASNGWNITAVGASELVNGNDAVTKMAPDASGKDPIATGTATDAGSTWAFQVTGTGTVASYNSYSVIPSTATPVASGNAAVSGSTINTGYQVHVSTTQQAGTYTGKVTYTLSTGASS